MVRPLASPTVENNMLEKKLPADSVLLAAMAKTSLLPKA